MRIFTERCRIYPRDAQGRLPVRCRDLEVCGPRIIAGSTEVAAQYEQLQRTDHKAQDLYRECDEWSKENKKRMSPSAKNIVKTANWLRDLSMRVSLHAI